MAKWLRGAAQVAVAVAKWLKRIWRNVQWGPTAPWPGCVGPMSWSGVGPHAAASAWSMTNVFDVTPGGFWRVIADHGVSVLLTAPTAFRAIKRGGHRR